MIKTTWRNVKRVFIGLLLICLITFMVDNRQNITISTYPLPYSFELKAFLVMIIFFMLGLLCGLVICSYSLMKKSFENFKNRLKIKKLEQKK